jgi:hypothetical protein
MDVTWKEYLWVPPGPGPKGQIFRTRKPHVKQYGFDLGKVNRLSLDPIPLFLKIRKSGH